MISTPTKIRTVKALNGVGVVYLGDFETDYGVKKVGGKWFVYAEQFDTELMMPSWNRLAVSFTTKREAVLSAARRSDEYNPFWCYQGDWEKHCELNIRGTR